MGQNLPGLDSIRVFDRELFRKIFQLQDDHGFRFTSRDNQSAGNSFPAIHAHHDRTLAAIEG